MANKKKNQKHSSSSKSSAKTKRAQQQTKQASSPEVILRIPVERHYEMIAKALECGAIVDRLTMNNRRALHFFCEQGDMQITKLLLDAGADTEIVEKESGWTPLWFAATNGHLGVVKLLLEYGAKKCPESLVQSLINGYPAIARILLEETADPNAEAEFQFNANRAFQGLCCLTNNIAAVKVVLE